MPKLAFMLPQYAEYVGEWSAVPIGLNLIDSLPTTEAGTAVTPHFFYVELSFIKDTYTRRPKFAHKGMFGHALLLCGSEGKTGAAALAVRACLRSGVGLVTAHVAKCSVPILQTLAPEAMCSASRLAR